MPKDLFRKVLIRLSSHENVDGLWLGYDHDEKELVPKVCKALTLIKVHDPRRYARILKDIRRVFINLLPGSYGQFVVSDLSCDLDPRFIRSSSPELIASAIVHEATHARLHRFGIGYSEQVRGRVERTCTRRQLAFARKLPCPEPISNVTWALDYPDSTWSNSELEIRRDVGSVEALRHLNIPEWIITAVLFLAKTLRSVRRRHMRIKGGHPN